MNKRGRDLLRAFDWWAGSLATTNSIFLVGNDVDPANRYIKIYFSKSIYSSDGTDLKSTDLQLIFAANGGTATNATIASVKNVSNGSLVGGETIIRVNITLTGSASGVESVTLRPASSSSVRDVNGDSATIVLNTTTCVINPTYDTDYAAHLAWHADNGNIVPIREYRAVENNLVIDAKAKGVWQLSDLFYPLSIYGGVNYFLSNWKTPGSFNCTVNGTISYVRGTGYTPGSGSFITNWIPATNAVNYTLNAASVVHASVTNVASATQIDYGTTTLGNAAIQIRNLTRNGGDSSQISLNSGNLATLAGVPTSIGLFHNNRSASTSAGHKYYKDGVLVDGANATSSGLPDQNLVFGAERVAAGTISGTTTRKITFFMTGGDMESLAASVNTMYTTYTAAVAGVSATAKVITTDSGSDLTTDTPNTLTTS